MGVGTSTGHVMLYDIRATRARLVKNHYYELPIKNIHFHGHDNRIVSSDTKIVKIWDSETGDNFTSIEPGVTINDTCVYRDSGLIFLANEAQKNSVFYVPALGQAPRWCSFLDNITEELEESSEVIVYDDYKFVTSTELDDLGLAHLRGTNVLRAYMHGYFLDMRLYHKAKSIVEPFAYEQYRRDRIKAKVEEERASRIKMSKMPKVNKQLAEKLFEAANKKGKGKTTAAVKQQQDGGKATQEEDDDKGKLLYIIMIYTKVCLFSWIRWLRCLWSVILNQPCFENIYATSLTWFPWIVRIGLLDYLLLVS